MSIGFNWFKSLSLVEIDDYTHDQRLEYIGGGSTSHSAGNIKIVQNLLEKYAGVQIPYIYNDYSVDQLPSNLIKPHEMAKACEAVLQTTEVDDADMRFRIEWFKELSEQGYYLSYDIF